MHDVEARRAMQPTYGMYGPQTCVADADIMDMRSEKIPLAYPGLLVQSEYLNIVVEREPPYQGQQCGNYAILSRSIDTPRYYQRDSHTWRARPCYRGPNNVCNASTASRGCRPLRSSNAFKRDTFLTNVPHPG